ncbi:MAG: excinuclease ABC subunit C [Gammaproteobacteria bacterium]|nr:MAG: excinuclease ABC subunit C [Gammaproteobacteria bacterium]
MNDKVKPRADAAFEAKIFLQNVTERPGVYQMFDADNRILYVGKAGNLKKRLSSYFRQSGLSIKNQSLMQRVADVRVIVTHSETEALILENNLIKRHRPRYNILLRDDKTYPYIHLTADKYPLLKFYRGGRTAKGKYFGPYPSAAAVKETLDILQKVFQIRNCDNTFFNNRSRPCLQYQIKRCSAPCMNLVNHRQYQSQIDAAIAFLEGNNESLLADIEYKMLAAAERMAFEEAAFYRDQLQSLRKILEKQYITQSKGDADVIVVLKDAGVTVIQVFYYRSGRSLGTQSYFPKVRHEHDESEILQSFIEQMYFDKAPPAELITNMAIANNTLLRQFFSDKFSVSVRFVSQPREHRARWLKLALDNAQLALYNKKISTMTLAKQFEALKNALKLEQSPGLMACVDVSHTQGEATVASYVVFDRNGPKKSDYRKYNIKGIAAGDDYGAMEQLLRRRFVRFQAQAKKNEDGISERIPDILFVDGGLGQFHVAENVLSELGVDEVLLVGVAKGADRKAGQERLIVGTGEHRVKLLAHDPAMHLIQQIRDESHRFAITGHRKKRDKKRFVSELSEIDGIGDKKRQSLLKYFAGIKGVKNAAIEELQKVDGISPTLAAKIYDYFH